MRNMLTQSWLWGLFLTHRRRLAVFTGVSLLGSALLFTAVKGLNLDPKVANAILSPPMFLVGFFVLRRYGFPDRETAPVLGLGKWGLKWVAMTPLTQSAFIWLVDSHGINFLVAKVVVGSVACVPGYLFANLVVFGSGFRRAASNVRVFAIRVWALGIEKA
ncbi:hypothetical protein KW792_02615 [Candidatus Saccharibacteria bacterium]|nr:hypothetical protein [Candidatus Saccharibacteria bacterium]